MDKVQKANIEQTMLNKQVMFNKLAAARFEAFLREHGMSDELIKIAIMEGAGEKFMKGIGKHDPVSMFKNPAEFMRQTGRRFKSELTRGTLASPETAAKGFKATLGRGLNRLFAGMSVMEAGQIATRKREKGTGFFEDVGGRAGEVAGIASVYAPGMGIAKGMAAAMGLGVVGKYTGKAMDIGLQKARQAGRNVRGLFGGGQTFAAKKRKAMTKRPKAPKTEKQHELKADYQ